MAKNVRDEVMPLLPIEIAPVQRSALLAWLDAGAPPRGAGDTCSDFSAVVAGQGAGAEAGQDPGPTTDDAGAVDDADDGSAAPASASEGDAEASDTDSASD